MNCRKIAVFRCYSGLWLFFYFKCLTRTIISLKILYSPLDNSIKLNYDRALFGVVKVSTGILQPVKLFVCNALNGKLKYKR